MASEAYKKRDAKSDNVCGERVQARKLDGGTGRRKMRESGRAADRDEDGDLLHQGIAGISGKRSSSAGRAALTVGEAAGALALKRVSSAMI